MKLIFRSVLSRRNGANERVTGDLKRPSIYVGGMPYVELGIVLAALAVYEHFFSQDAAGGQLFNLWMFYAAVVVGFWFVFGASGQFAFCQAAFIGIGGYSGNLWGGDKNFWIGAGQAILICGVISLLFGAVVRKTSHLYFAIVTLGLAEIAGIIFINWTSFTGGVAGVASGIPPIRVFGSSLDTQPRVFWILLAFFGLLMLLKIWFERSPAYRDTIAFRDNPVVASTLGIPIERIRLATFVIGSVMAGLAGAIYVHWTSFSSPQIYSLDLGVAILLMLVLGGTNYRWGPLVGAWFYTYAFQIIPVAAGWQSAIYGVILVLVLLGMPRGIGGAIEDLRGLARKRSVTFLRRHRGVERTEESGASSTLPSPVPSVSSYGTIGLSDSIDDGATLLDAENIRVTFGGVVAVAGVRLSVSVGEIVGLIGPNGSGKTSLLNALSGIVDASGELRIGGKRIKLGKPRRIRRIGVLRTFQAPQNYGELSCLENVLLSSPDRRQTGVIASWVNRGRMFRFEHDRWSSASAALARVGLSDVALESSNSLPYGQERMLELARAIAGRPRLLLLDEPSAGLTASETETLGALLQGLRADGVTMVIVDHKIDFLTPLCDRLIVLDLGEVIANGPATEVFRDERVVDAYLGGKRVM